jgi:hypothetical protein
MKIKNYIFAFLLTSISLSSFAQGVLWQENFDGVPAGSFPSTWQITNANGNSIGWFADSTNFSTGYAGATGLKNAVIKNTSNSTGIYSTTSPSFITTGKSGITVLWASRVSNNFSTSGSTQPTLYYSITLGSSWDSIPYNRNPANSAWSFVNGGTAIQLPSQADNQTSVLLKWEVQIDTAASGTYRIDDVTVSYTGSSSCATPNTLTSANITSSSATIGWAIASGAMSYNIQYKPSSSSTWLIGSNTVNTFNLSGLSPLTSYDFQIQTVCGIGSNSAFSTISNFTTLNGTGINNVNLNDDLNIKLSPIPTKELLVVSSKSFVNSIQVINLLGAKMKVDVIRLSTTDLQLNTSDLTSGIYFLQTTDNKGIQHTTKFIKE